jgi:hypothetical protein
MTMPIVTVEQSPRDLVSKRARVAGVTQAFVDAYGVTVRDTVWPEKPSGTDESLSSSAFNGRDPGGCGGLDR